jgi:hypothetical protein
VFVAAGGFEHDQRRGERLKPRDERGERAVGVGHLPVLAGGVHREIEVSLGDIEADKERGRGHGQPLVVIAGPHPCDDTGSRPRQLCGVAIE